MSDWIVQHRIAGVKKKKAMTGQKREDATMTVEDAHKLIGQGRISRGSLYAAINRGEVPHIRLGKRILIPREAFLKFLGQST